MRDRLPLIKGHILSIIWIVRGELEVLLCSCHSGSEATKTCRHYSCFGWPLRLVAFFFRELSQIRITERGNRQSKGENYGGKNDVSEDILLYLPLFLPFLAVSFREVRPKKLPRVAGSPETAVMRGLRESFKSINTFDGVLALRSWRIAECRP